MSQRVIFLGGFAISAGLMAAALYFQYVDHLEPCPLCILQRLAVIGVGLILLAGGLHNPGKWGRRRRPSGVDTASTVRSAARLQLRFRLHAGYLPSG